MTTDTTDHVIDDVWDWLNEATNHGTQPFDYDQVAHAVREALAGYTVIETPKLEELYAEVVDLSKPWNHCVCRSCREAPESSGGETP